jgi:aspartate kinase
LKADLYENWTDVSGFLVTDPHLIENPMVVDVITYRELRELAYMGAAVLHDEAIFPVRKAGIPINIRNTNRPEDPGTMITSEADKKHGDQIISGIAGNKGYTVVNVLKTGLCNERGFLRRLAGVLEDHDITIEHIPSGIDTVSVVLSDKAIDGRLDEIIESLQQTLKPDSIDTSADMALIATVGVGMASRVGVSAQLFTALAQAGVNIRMIDQGSSEMNIIIGVENKDFETAVKAIYEAFVV